MAVAGEIAKLEGYLAFLASHIPPGDPLFAEVQDSVAALRAVFQAPVPPPNAAQHAQDRLQAALAAFVQQRRRDLARILLDGLPDLPPVQQAIEGGDWFSPDGITARAEIGPLRLGVGLGGVTIALDVPQPAGPPLPLPPLAVGPGRPDRVDVELQGPVGGKGTMRVLPDGVSGALRLPLGPVTVDALASLRRLPGGGPSFLALLSASFRPGIQIGFGFALDRVGGVVGIDRRVDLDELTRGIRSGSAADILFGGGDQGRRLAGVERLFPPAAGLHLLGPSFGLAWLSLGPDAALVHLDLGVVVQLGGPLSVAIVGPGASSSPSCSRFVSTWPGRSTRLGAGSPSTSRWSRRAPSAPSAPPATPRSGPSPAAAARHCSAPADSSPASIPNPSTWDRCGGSASGPTCRCRASTSGSRDTSR